MSTQIIRNSHLRTIAYYFSDVVRRMLEITFIFVPLLKWFCMKYVAYSFILWFGVLAFSFQSCQSPIKNSSLSEALERVNQLTYTSPDSAIVALEKLSDNIHQATEEQQMYYKLLIVKARDKAYLPHLSDSLIREVVAFYQKRDNKDLYAESLYYLGRVHMDLQQDARALGEFLKVIDMADEKNYLLKGLAYAQIGTLFLYQGMNQKGLEAHKNSYKYKLLLGDDNRIVFGLRDIGRTYTTLQQPDSAIHYYIMARDWAIKIDNPELEEMVCSELGGYYIDLGRYKEAYECIQVTVRDAQQRNSVPTLSVLADYYLQVGQLDSAGYYYRRLLDVQVPLAFHAAYRGLASIARRRGELSQALAYYDRYMAYADTLQAMAQEEAMGKIKSAYDYQQYHQENNALRQESTRQKLLIVFLLLAVLFFGLALVGYRQFRKRREREAELRYERLQQLQREQQQQGEQQHRQNLQRIESLEHALREARTGNDPAVRELLQSQKELAEKNNEQIEARQKVRQQAVAALRRSDIYRRFHRLADENGKPAETDWLQLEEAVDAAYERFSIRLRELYPPLRDVELQVCLLVKIDLQPSQAAALILRSRQAVASLRSRLYAKVFGRKGSPDDWDAFLKEL